MRSAASHVERSTFKKTTAGAKSSPNRSDHDGVMGPPTTTPASRCGPTRPGGFADTIYERPRVSAAIKRLRKRATMEEALRSTNLHLLVRYNGPSNESAEAANDYPYGSDHQIAEYCGMEITYGSWYDADIQGYARARAQVPRRGFNRRSCLTRLHERYMQAIDMLVSFDEHGMGGDDMLAIELPGKDREVAIPSLIFRIVHRAVANELSRRFDRPRDAYAHRGGISRWNALAAAKRLIIKTDYVFAATVDIKKFFTSTQLGLAIEAAQAEIPGLEADLITLIRGLHAANIIRDRARADVRLGPPIDQHDERQAAMDSTPGTLLQGTGVAPVLSEMVAAYLLDRPFEARFGGRARLLRYSDDALVLSNDPVVVAEALAFIAEALASQYTLHPDKTSKYPLDLRGVALRFLGKWVSAAGIVTPMPRVRQLVDALVSTELNSCSHRKACGELRRELILDTTEVMHATSTWLETDGPEWFELFRDLHLQWQPQRRALLNRLISPRRRRSKAAPSHAA